jgi:hypothetical protein
MTTDPQPVENIRHDHDHERSAMNSQTFEPRIVAFCCQY